MKISIIIPWYNTDWLVEKNLPVVQKAFENKKNNICEIVVVDDGSTDKSYSLIKSNFPSIKIIKHKTNKGFSASVNTGVRSSKGDLICLINSDVVPEINFLEDVIKYFDDKKVFAVSLNEAGVFGWAKGNFKDGYIGHEPGIKSDKVHDTFWVSGGSGVFRRSTWVEIGGMDEKLLSPFYWEDLDLGYRALKRGYILLWDPIAKVEHKHETTMTQLPKDYVQRIRERNQLLFIWKNLTSKNLFRKHVAAVFKRIIEHPGYLRIVLMAFSRIQIVVKERAREKRESKVSDEVVLSRFK